MCVYCCGLTVVQTMSQLQSSMVNIVLESTARVLALSYQWRWMNWIVPEMNASESSDRWQHRLHRGIFYISLHPVRCLLVVPLCYSKSFPLSLCSLVTLLTKNTSTNRYNLQRADDLPLSLLFIAPLHRCSFPSGRLMRFVCTLQMEPLLYFPAFPTRPGKLLL